MAKKQLALQGEVVKKSNAIARARWFSESIWEPRIVALVASKVRIDDEDFQTYRIPVMELTGASDENLRGNQYQEIRKSIEHLGKSIIRIEGDKPRNFRQYNVFAMCGYEDGYLIAGFHPDLKPHFLQLKNNFIKYNLVNFLMLPSTYSQKLFEILKSWDDKPEIEISISELHEMLDVPESFKANFKDFRRRVLEKAHKDITKHTELEYEWEPIKQGRSVISIRFTFTKNRSLPVAEKKRNDAKVKQSRATGEAFTTAIACYQERGNECRGGHQKKAVCSLCRHIYPR